MSRLSRLLLLCLLLIAALPAAAQDAPPDPACPGAPAPRLIVDGNGRVLPGDSNNVRDQPIKGGMLVGAIPGSGEFKVLEGPVCADGLNWWRVESGEIAGWTVEGSGADYWIEPLAPAVSVDIEWSNPFRSPKYPVANHMIVGAVARVQTMDGEPLPLYTALDESTPSNELPVNTLVTLQEEGAGGWWRVESEDGAAGWVREAIPQVGTMAGMRPTLAPVCPYSENRVLFLAFDSALGSNLYTVGRDATHLCNLSYGLQQDFEVYDWSPDGAWIAYSAVVEGSAQCAAGCSGELYVESVDGSILRRLTFNQNVSHVQWSPDGAWIAAQIDGAEARTRDLRLFAPDGSAERTLLTTDTQFRLMRWSPDGKQLAVIEDRGTPVDFWQVIHVIDADTGDARIAYEAEWRLESLSWSPDGAFLAAATSVDTGRKVLLEISVESGEHKVLVDAETRGAVYSMDGKQVAFWRTDLGAVRWVEVLDRSTGDITRLATLPGVHGRGISWTPEGDALLIGSSGVMRVDAADGGLRSLFVGSFGSNWYPPLVQPGAGG